MVFFLNRGDFFMTGFSVPPFLAGLLLLVLGIYALYWEKASRVSLIFALTTWTAAVWLLGYAAAFGCSDPAAALLWIKISHAGVCFIPAFVYLFVLTILGGAGFFHRAAPFVFWISAMIYTTGLSTGTLVPFTGKFFWGHYAHYGPMGVALTGYFLAMNFASLGLLWHGYKASPAGTAKLRLRALLFAFIAGHAGIVDFLPAYGIEIYPSGYLAVVAFTVLAGYAVWKYHLVEWTPAFAANQILETMQDAVLVVDHDRKIRVANRAACELLGYPSDSILQRDCREIMGTPFQIDVGPGGAELTIENKLVIWRGRAISDYPMDWTAKDGRIIRMSVSASILPGNRGKVEGIIYAAKDVTERRKAEEALRESEDKLRLMIESVKDYAILRLDSDGLVASWNSGAERIKGYKAEEIIGRHFSCFFPPEDLQSGKPEKELRAAIQDGRAEDEGWRLRKDGTLFWANVVITAIKDRSGNLRGFTKVTRDITERRRIEDALRASEEKLRAIFNTARDAIITADALGRIVSVNRGAEAVFGYTAAEMTGQSLTLLMPERYRDAHLHGIRAFKAEGGGKLSGRTLELEGLRKDGTEFPLELSLSHGVVRTGIFFTAIIRDITERKQAEQAIRHKKDLEMKASFISMVSHELRTPLTAIKMAIDTITSESRLELSGEHAEWMDMAKRNVDRLARLIKGVLDYQKIDAGRMVLDRTPEDLNALILEVEKTLRPLAHVRGLDLVFHLDPAPLVVDIDRDKMIEVLMNLIGNALKFTDKGTIRVASSRQGGKAEATVSDTGIGVREEDLPKLFTDFTQVHSSRSGGGSGLGLAISKKIVEQHGGEIGVESEYGKGSRFFVRLALAAPAAAYER